MTANDAIQLAIQSILVALFVVVLADAVRRPNRVRVATALFFGAMAAIVAEGWVARFAHAPLPAAAGSAVLVVLLALPYLLLRLVDALTVVRPGVLRAAACSALAAATAGVLLRPLPGPVALAVTVEFFVWTAYAGGLVARAARGARGVTRHRLGAVAIGSVGLGMALLGVGLAAAIPTHRLLFTGGLYEPAAAVAGVAYFLGFAPPPLLRRAWQEPALRAFLARTAQLPGLLDPDAVATALKQATADALGAHAAALGLWDEATAQLIYLRPDGVEIRFSDSETLTGRAFAEQRPLVSSDAAHDDPAHAALYRSSAATAVLAVPVTTSARRIGVLSVFGPRQSLFVDEDIALLRLLADHSAIVLENRALAAAAARVAAREEASRLKDDFLSAAAHDLKTPLTALVGSAQLALRRITRDPGAPADPVLAERIAREAERLRTLVVELLDAGRADEGRLVGVLAPTDVAAIVREVCARHAVRHRIDCSISASCGIDRCLNGPGEDQRNGPGEDQRNGPGDGPGGGADPVRVLAGPGGAAPVADGALVAVVDRVRFAQLVENLVENAVKYSPDGAAIDVRVVQHGADLALTVRDRGIGIPAADLEGVFERFHRASNVDDRRFAGMGLGLHICQAIVTGHGGTIAVESPPAGTVGAERRGTRFVVTLPVTAPPAAPPAALPEPRAATAPR